MLEGARQVKGSNLGFGDEKLVPFYRMQANWEVDDKLEIFLRGDFANGELDLSPSHLDDGRVDGNFQSVGAGVNYYPFDHHFSLNLGVEFFHANFDLEGELWGFNHTTEDSVIGWGASIGVTYELGITPNFTAGFFVQYNLTDNESRRGSYDFDGFGAGVQFKFVIPKPR